jgi:hypothetical protein
MASATLPLSNIVDIVVSVSPIAPATPTFNQGLIVGPSTAIPSQQGQTSPRLRQYSTLSQMLSDGFTVNSPEYIAASIYFGQSPPPQFLWVGRQDLTSIQGMAANGGALGTNYAVGDVFLVNHGGASLGYGVVTGVGGGGAVSSIAIATLNGVLADGTGYAVSTANTTTTITGSGAGLQVDISAVGESPLVALQICRAVNSTWYACMVTGAVFSDHEAIGAWIQAITPASFYFFQTADVAVLNNTAGNIFAALKALNYNRMMGIYSTTQSGAFPNNIYAAAALMGVAMGLNTGLARSYFTMMFKQLTGITVEPLTQTQVFNIAGNPGSGTGNNGNVYVNFSSAYSILMQGVVPSGQFFDEILNLDMLTSDIQFSTMNLLVGNPSIPQTDAGQAQLLHAVNGAAERAAVRGFIAKGVWEGVGILNLVAGDPLPSGYLSQSAPYSTQSNSDHVARKAMPIYLAIIEAGAVHFVLIGIYVQR